MSKTKHKTIQVQKDAEKEYTYEDRIRDDKKKAEEYELKEYGVVTRKRDPSDAKYNQVIAVPVEIEVPWEVDQLTKLDILSRFKIKVDDKNGLLIYTKK